MYWRRRGLAGRAAVSGRCGAPHRHRVELGPSGSHGKNAPLIGARVRRAHSRLGRRVCVERDRDTGRSASRSRRRRYRAQRRGERPFGARALPIALLAPLNSTRSRAPRKRLFPVPRGRAGTSCWERAGRVVGHLDRADARAAAFQTCTAAPALCLVYRVSIVARTVHCGNLPVWSEAAPPAPLRGHFVWAARVTVTSQRA